MTIKNKRRAFEIDRERRNNRRNAFRPVERTESITHADGRALQKTRRYEIREVKQVGALCVVVARITIHASDGCLWREATGSEPLDTDTWGDPSNAESMALRRAAAKLGLGLYLYDHAR